MASDLLVIGVGRPRFGDDALGLLAAQALRDRLGDEVRVLSDEGAGLASLPVLAPLDLLVVIDAAEAGEGFLPGEWRRLRYPADADALVECRLRDTHTLGVSAALRMAQALDALPRETWLYCLAGEQFAPETELSPAVSGSLARMIDRIEATVQGWLEADPERLAPECPGARGDRDLLALCTLCRLG